jgi:hypothetical protein
MMRLGAADAAELQRLEEELLRPDVRRSPEKMAALLADDFIEFGSSGRRYGKADLLATAAQPGEGRLALLEFAAHALAPSIVLVTYRSIHRDADGSARHALRSSICRRTEHGWRLVFHVSPRHTHGASALKSCHPPIGWSGCVGPRCRRRAGVPLHRLMCGSRVQSSRWNRLPPTQPREGK